MEKQLDTNTIATSIHNKYVIELSRNGETIQKAVAYNQANSKAYMQYGYIDTIALLEKENSSYALEKKLEPYDNDTITNYWQRAELPISNDKEIITCYKTKIYFNNIDRSGCVGYVQLRAGNSVISKAPLKDMEGDPIALKYDTYTFITITAFIYFVADISSRNDRDHLHEVYPIKWYQGGYSVLGGCCDDKTTDLMTRVTRYNHSNAQINDGYLPYPIFKYYAISRAPMPPEDNYGLLKGCITNYEIIAAKGSQQIYKNKSISSIKGLVRTLVLPGLGAIDLLEATEKRGPLNKGIFEGTEVKGQHPCYIPQEYVKEKDDSLISITKNAFYNGKAIVRRFNHNTTPVEVENNTPYYSNFNTDNRLNKCISFSQHIPLTDDYVGAESVIPCDPGSFIEDYDRNGYYITYYGKDENTYLMCNYAVTGEVVITSYDNLLDEKIIFPYKLEYLDENNNFITVVDFSEEGMEPYKAYKFPTVAAPVWRISANVSGRMLANGGNTTHSDFYVSEAAGTSHIGYDPLFIFVGYDGSDAPVVPEGIKIAKTPVFKYGDSMGKLNVYHTKVPYTCHPNDTLFFTCNMPKE